MARIPRSSLPDGIYHATARGTGGCAIFLDDDDRRLFLGLLGRTAVRCDWVCHAFCLMSTHYHLVVEAQRARLSDGMHRLNGIYAQEFNRRRERYGHLFQSRFEAGVIESEKHFEAACAYVVENPVRAGLCAQIEDWPWSGLAAARRRAA